MAKSTGHKLVKHWSSEDEIQTYRDRVEPIISGDVQQSLEGMIGTLQNVFDLQKDGKLELGVTKSDIIEAKKRTRPEG